VGGDLAVAFGASPVRTGRRCDIAWLHIFKGEPFGDCTQAEDRTGFGTATEYRVVACLLNPTVDQVDELCLFNEFGLVYTECQHCLDVGWGESCDVHFSCLSLLVCRIAFHSDRCDVRCSDVHLLRIRLARLGRSHCKWHVHC